MDSCILDFGHTEETGRGKHSGALGRRASLQGAVQRVSMNAKLGPMLSQTLLQTMARTYAVLANVPTQHSH